LGIVGWGKPGWGEKMSEKRVVIVGATGMIGGLVLRYAVEDPGVEWVMTLGRRPTGVLHSKLQEITHDDFTDFHPVQGNLEDQDVAFFCLGAYAGTVPDDEFRKITVDYTVAFAGALHKASPGAVFCLLSGAGADQTEKSRMSFARYKGAAETALLSLGFFRVHLFRPGYIYPVTPRSEPNLTYRIMRWVYPALRRLHPNIGISSEDLARAMLRAGLTGTPGRSAPILENRDIRRLAAEIE
jgi:uncharacterized protein YbjT (DUF2867 family)